MVDLSSALRGFVVTSQAPIFCSDDIATLKTLAADLVDGLSKDSAGVDVDLRLGLASFSDLPVRKR